MAAKMTFVIVLGCGFGFSGAVIGQDTTDMLGKWTYTATGLPEDPRCGARSGGGEMLVERKITARAYRGSIRSYETTERCRGTSISESALTVRIRDNKVSIDYDEEGWTAASLILDGSVMRGKDENGVSTEWRKQAVVADQVVAASTEATGELEAYLASVKPEVTQRLSDYYGERLQKGLNKTGLNNEQAQEVAELTMQRMLSCMLDMVRDDFKVEGLPFSEYLRNSHVRSLLNPRAVDFRGVGCVQDAAQNAGVSIR